MRKIGDKVTIVGWDEPLEIASVYRGKEGEEAYKLFYEGSTEVFGIVEEDRVNDYYQRNNITFTVNVRERENLVEVFMVDEDGAVIERAHGHIKEASALGVVQALDYATMRLHRNMEQF